MLAIILPAALTRAANSYEFIIAPEYDNPLVSLSQPLEDVMILGKAEATQEQMVRFINHRNSNTKLNCSIEEIVAFYYEEAEREGIRADLALCQALKETGFFNYGGDVEPWQNNFCGLGATGNHVKGEVFETPRLGVRAHIQHLLAYTSKRPPKTEIVDPRYEIIATARPKIFGKIHNWLGLGGTFAVPGTYYGQDILNILKQALVPDGSPKTIKEANIRVNDNPNDPNAYIYRAIAYYSANQAENSIKDYNKALELEKSVEGYYNRALSFEKKTDFYQAIRDYTSAIEMDEYFPQAWYNRGRLYLLQERYDEAISDFEQILKLVPQMANARNNIGVIHAKLGNLEQAKRDFDDARRINSTNEVVQENLKLIGSMTSGSLIKEPKLIDKPISWTDRREKLTQEYAMEHYGSNWTTIEPQMVVVHWTAINSADVVYNYFNQDAAEDGTLQVASHFLVDRDGTIIRLTPETRLNRHAIGYNWCAIGIENVGGVNGKEDLTEAQLNANVELIKYLHAKYPSIKYVFGHYQQDLAKQSGLYLELVPNYYSIKLDPGSKFMQGLYERLKDDNLEFFRKKDGSF